MRLASRTASREVPPCRCAFPWPGLLALEAAPDAPGPPSSTEAGAMAETPFARRAVRASSHRGNDPSGDTRFNAQQLGCHVPAGLRLAQVGRGGLEPPTLGIKRSPFAGHLV